MTKIRTRKERVVLWDNSIAHGERKPDRHEKEAWIEYMAVEDVRDKYFEKLSKARKSLDEAEAAVALRKEKIRLASSEKEKLQYAQEISDFQRAIRMFTGEVEDFQFTHNLLNELCSVARRLINQEHFWEVVLAIPEHQLLKLARRKDGLKYIRELVERIYSELLAAERRNAEGREDHRKKKAHEDRKDDEAEKLIGNREQEDLKKIISDAEADTEELVDDTAVYDARQPNKV